MKEGAQYMSMSPLIVAQEEYRHMERKDSHIILRAIDPLEKKLVFAILPSNNIYTISN
jgi:hypothetical protein